MTTPDEAAAAAVERYVAGMSETEFAALIARTRMPGELGATLQRTRAGVQAGVDKLLALDVDKDGFVAAAPDPAPQDATAEPAKSSPTGMKPNPAQGGSAFGATVPKPPTTAEKADLLRQLTAQMNRGG